MYLNFYLLAEVPRCGEGPERKTKKHTNAHAHAHLYVYVHAHVSVSVYAYVNEVLETTICSKKKHCGRPQHSNSRYTYIYIYRVFRLTGGFLAAIRRDVLKIGFFLGLFVKFWSEFCKCCFWVFRLIGGFLSISAKHRTVLKTCQRPEKRNHTCPKD